MSEYESNEALARAFMGTNPDHLALVEYMESSDIHVGKHFTKPSNGKSKKPLRFTWVFFVVSIVSVGCAAALVMLNKLA